MFPTQMVIGSFLGAPAGLQPYKVENLTVAKVYMFMRERMVGNDERDCE